MKSLKKYFRSPKAVYYYLNRCIRNTALRNIAFRLVRIVVPKASVSGVKAEEFARLKRDGIVAWEQLVDAETAEKIRQFLLTRPVYDLREYDAGKDQKPLNLNEVKISQQMKLKYFDADVVQCREIIELANSPKVLSLVSAYLGCKPTISLMSAWWTKAGSGSSEKFYDDMFHRDVADYKFLKLFLYLTDVTAENGAHCFIKGSHASGKLTERRMFSDAEIDRNFSPPNHITLTGKSGSGFLEDTWGLHRSIPAVTGERLVVHIMYNLLTFDAGSPEMPLAKNIYAVDPYINRVYLY